MSEHHDASEPPSVGDVFSTGPYFLVAVPEP
jgi:hypothetical protein